MTHALAGKPGRRFSGPLPFMNSIPSRGHQPCPPRALALGLAACFAASTAFAQTTDSAPAVDPPQTVAVTALRTPEPISETVAEVTVITREQLDTYSGLSLTEILARQPGIQLSSYGGLGQTSSLFIRGLSASSTVLLIDGVRVGSATSGTPSLDNLPVTLIDHIEIVRGPLSSIYGSDAIGGVVQVFTRRPRRGFTYGGEVTLGSLGYTQEKAGLAYANGSVDAALDIQHTGTRGFSAADIHSDNYDPDRDGFQQDSVSARLGWQITPDWRLEAATFDSSGIVHYDDGPGIDSHGANINRLHSLKLTGNVLPGWNSELVLSDSADIADPLASHNQGSYETVQHQLSWINRLATPIGTLMTVLDATSQDVGKSKAVVFDRTKRDIYGAGLVLDGHAHGITWQASARHDHDSQFGSIDTGALALGYQLTTQWSVGSSFGNSFVAPSFDQLYYPGYGSPHLKPERGHTAEVNTRWVSGDSEARLSVYRSLVRDFITDGQSASNVALASIPGVTLSGQTRWNALVLQGSYDHLNPISHTPDGNTPLVRVAKNAVKANVTWELGEHDDVGAAWTSSSSRHDNDFQSVPPYATIPLTLAAYRTVDLFVDHKFTRAWSLGARLNNAGDKRYETAYGYNQPGRAVYVTLRFEAR